MESPDTTDSYVREFYAKAATVAANGRPSCSCGPNEVPRFGAALYPDNGDIPDLAALASLGCGNPVAVAELKPGDTVLDLGSGGGIDVLLSARRVGPAGKAYGVDFTPEMLSIANQNAAEASVTNVEFFQGHIDSVPLDDGTIDVIISNCVVNLSLDKSRVFAEMHRLLRPGGRIGIADVIADEDLSPDDRAAFATECIAGALTASEYLRGLADAGFEAITISPTHDVGPGAHSAIVHALKPE